MVSITAVCAHAGRVLYLDIVHSPTGHSAEAGSAAADPHAAKEPNAHAAHTISAPGAASSDHASPPGLGAGPELLARKGSWRFAGPGRTFAPRWISAEVLRDRGLVVSKRMFSMHLPDFQMDVLRGVLADRMVHVPFVPVPMPVDVPLSGQPKKSTHPS